MNNSMRVPDFSIGIDRLIHAQDDSESRLPARSELAPTGVAVRVNLDNILRQPSAHEQALLDFVKPMVSNSFTLTPSRYQQLLASAREALAKLADESGDESLAKGAGLIQEEQQLMNLLATQRNLLVGA